MIVESMFLSKVLEERNRDVLYKVSKDDFTDYEEVYTFIYNMDSIPDKRTVINKYKTFEYVEDVQDTFEYLVKELKLLTAKRKLFVALKQAEKDFNNKLSIEDTITTLKRNVDNIYTKNISNNNLFNLKDKSRLHLYDNPLFKLKVATPFNTINKSIGSMESGDYVLFTAFTNRGKSWVACKFGIEALKQGCTVLHYAPEIQRHKLEYRLDTILNGFNNRNLNNSSLEEETYKEYKRYIEGFKYDNYYIRTMENMDNLDLNQIESDIKTIGADFVIIDGFILMNHGKADSKRNSYSDTSRSLRKLFVKAGVIGLVLHQVSGKDEKENNKKGDNGIRILKPPDLHQYSETIALIQDATTIMTYDRVDATARIKLVKAKSDTTDTEVDLIIDYNKGVIEEMAELLKGGECDEV